jgi:hypothetical protein
MNIKAITKHFTSFINDGVRPNCIVNWANFVHTAHIPFGKVFESFGTPISDPTEERQWRKLVHRATNVRNRNPKLADQNCRLCGKHVEQIHTLFQCQATAPLWRACVTFTKDVLKAPNPHDMRDAIIFGIWSHGKLGPEIARAFLRHAYNVFYHDFSNVDVKNGHFVWQVTFREAIYSFRSAVLRYAVGLRQLHHTRIYTDLTNRAPREAYDRYHEVIHIEPAGQHTLTDTFQRAIDAAINDANAAISNHARAQPNQPNRQG